MILTGKAKEDFKKWWHINRSADIWNYENSQYTFYDFCSLHPSMNYGVIIDWFDSVSIFIHIEPHIGGGAEVFYPEIIYRNKDFIDIHEKVENTKYMPPDMYFDSRQEATKQAIIKANEIYNLQFSE